MQAVQPKFILITSCKGGVGKSTCAVNIAAALGKAGHPTLLCDCNFDMRCLDLLLGVEDEVIYDLADVALERVPPERAILSFENRPELCFLAAPHSDGNSLTADRLRSALSAAAQSRDFEFVILDTPGTLVSPALLKTGLVNEAAVVSTHTSSSIRAADLTGTQLDEYGIEKQRLIINCFDLDGAGSKRLPDINEIIDRSFVRLGGVIPYDKAVTYASESGRLAIESTRSSGARGTSCVNDNTAKAFANTAERLSGGNVPLFDGFSGFGVARKIKRLLG